ncbi:sensor histidine kinase [Brevundimonas sp. PAMC22021]|uniref:sensor histidine kinase n=1 Tax=Brevundimonas sp. PAMC22021 TaxID=2861285 RepID=UPI001C630D3E|nr:sensor histidine kinase [Brevundimonas sp. PAMC22021]QYF86972.1 sensor histidine kinase [Brevundimonas sp. PAMC22021]
MLAEVFAPYPQASERVDMDGPLVPLHPSQAVAISMACHELATNAVKYGALQGQNGRVSVTWNLAHNGKGERFLTLLWREAGGPPVHPPKREGFGSKMIRRTFLSESGGRAEVSYAPDGAQCVLVLQLKDTDETAVNVVDARETAKS